MQAVNFEETLDKIVLKDSRYHRDAYCFLREALDYTQKPTAKAKDDTQHITGQQLLEGIRAYAVQQFGPMAMIVLGEWGVRRCQDFGEIVFNMVETNLLAKTENDSRNDFNEGYDFFEAFRRPYIPTRELLALEPEIKSTKV